MIEKQMTEKESLEIITKMIERTKERYSLGDGNILLMWGYLTVVVSLLVWCLLWLTHNNACNWCWFLIPLVGGIATPLMAKNKHKSGVVSYSDRIISRLWTTVGLSFLLLTVFCLFFTYVLRVDCWIAMLVYCLIVTPVAEMVNGIVLKESSMQWGGAITLVIGLFTLCCVTGGIPLGASWFMPLFILAFIVMMIIPGHIINSKASKNA